MFFVSRIIKNLDINKKITVLDPNPIKDEPKIYDIKSMMLKLTINKKTLVLNSVYYNFLGHLLL